MAQQRTDNFWERLKVLYKEEIEQIERDVDPRNDIKINHLEDWKEDLRKLPKQQQDHFITLSALEEEACHTLLSHLPSEISQILPKHIYLYTLCDKFGLLIKDNIGPDNCFTQLRNMRDQLSLASPYARSNQIEELYKGLLKMVNAIPFHKINDTFKTLESDKFNSLVYIMSKLSSEKDIEEYYMKLSYILPCISSKFCWHMATYLREEMQQIVNIHLTLLPQCITEITESYHTSAQTLKVIENYRTQSDKIIVERLTKPALRESKWIALQEAEDEKASVKEREPSEDENILEMPDYEVVKASESTNILALHHTEATTTVATHEQEMRTTGDHGLQDDWPVQ